MTKIGYKHTKEARIKMSIANKGKHLSEETKKKIKENNSHYWLGKKRSNEDIEKFRKSHLGQVAWNKGKKGVMPTPWNKGKKICCGLTWKGGISKDAQHYCRERRVRKMNCGGNHTFQEWDLLKAQYNWTCPCCHKSEPEIKLTEDHIIPLSKGGSDNIENIQPLCKSCNSKKYTKIIKYEEPLSEEESEGDIKMP